MSYFHIDSMSVCYLGCCFLNFFFFFNRLKKRKLCWH